MLDYYDHQPGSMTSGCGTALKGVVEEAAEKSTEESAAEVEAAAANRDDEFPRLHLVAGDLLKFAFI